jgi:hypothetical protein
MFYGLATNHDFWKERINLFVALAPVVNLSNTQSKFIKWISKADGTIGGILWISGKVELYRKGKVNWSDSYICRFIPGCNVMAKFLDTVLNPYEDSDRVFAGGSHFPNGSSLQ